MELPSFTSRRSEWKTISQQSWMLMRLSAVILNSGHEMASSDPAIACFRFTVIEEMRKQQWCSAGTGKLKRVGKAFKRNLKQSLQMHPPTLKHSPEK